MSADASLDVAAARRFDLPERETARRERGTVNERRILHSIWIFWSVFVANKRTLFSFFFTTRLQNVFARYEKRLKIRLKFQLLFLLASSAVLVQGYGKSSDPNDEPFLPIYPVYPYSPKLIKRGTEKEAVAQLSAELYAPKVDAKDSYSASYSADHPRDSYYNPNYNPYSKLLPSSPGYAFYGSLPYHPNDPYAYNPYSMPPYPPSPSYSPPIPYSSSYPNYYYQSPYYYHPNYYNQPLFPPPPLPPPVADYQTPGDAAGYSELEGSGEKEKKQGEGKDHHHHQFVDGANYISASSKDLDGQPTTYKNQLEQATGNAQTTMKYFPIPLPRTTYRVISVGGQPVGPDYPLPPSYVKAQQLDEIARGSHDSWVKVLAKNLRPEYEGKSVVAANNDNDSQNEEGKETRYVPVSSPIAKTGLAYVVNPSVLRQKVNAGQRNVGQKTRLKSVKYPTVYATIEKPDKDQGESNEYENYESSSSQDNQDYDSSLAEKQQSYDEEQPYQNQNYVTQTATPRYSGYQYTSYSQPQTIAQRQTQQYKSNPDSVNFGAKTKKA